MIVLATLVSNVLGCSRFDPRALERDLRAQAQREGWSEPTLHCDARRLHAGDHFTCPVSFANGKNSVVEITAVSQTNFVYKIKNLVRVNQIATFLEAAIRARTGRLGHVMCASRNAPDIFRPEEKLVCVHESVEGTAEIEVTLHSETRFEARQRGNGMRLPSTTRTK